MKRDRVKEILKKYFLVFLIFLGVFLIWLLFSNIIISEFSEYKDSLQNLGMFGDSFNILTSLFTGLAFGGVLISIHLQKEELIKVSNEMVIQSFDNKFFQMLNLFNDMINSFTEKVRYGHNRISTSSSGMHTREPSQYSIHEKRDVLVRIKSKIELTISNGEDFQSKFDKINQEYDTTFKFYFINLYQILKYIDRQFKEDVESAKNYTNIVRAQLSKDELVLLFYNAIGVIPFSGKKYKILVEKYAFFEHLTYNDLNPRNDRKVVDFLLKQYDPKAFGQNEDLKTKALSLEENK